MLRQLRVQLLLWLLLPLGVLVGVNVWTVWQSARDAAAGATNRLLLAAGQTIAEQVRIVGGVAEAPIPAVVLQMFPPEHDDLVYYRVTTQTKRLLAGYPDLPAPPARLTDLAPHVYETVYRGQRLRLVALLQPQVGGDEDFPVLVLFGATLHNEDAEILQFVAAALMQQCILLGGTALLVALGLRHSLARLTRLRDAIVVRDPELLEPFPVSGIQTELQPLVEAINLYMGRLRHQLQIRQRSLTDAAHQLRTPLAVLRTQATFAAQHVDAPDAREAVHSLLRTIGHMERMVAQMLTLSQAEFAAAQPQGIVDLARIVRATLEELAPSASTRGIALEYQSEIQSALMRGNDALLAQAVGNLVDNAIRYTHPGGHVVVALSAVGADWLVAVEDDGPGIAADDRERVFERFYRALGTGVEGSGLGLAIVREIAGHSGGRVTLRTPAKGPGVVAELRLPRAVNQ